MNNKIIDLLERLIGWSEWGFSESELKSIAEEAKLRLAEAKEQHDEVEKPSVFYVVAKTLATTDELIEIHAVMDDKDKADAEADERNKRTTKFKYVARIGRPL